MQHSVLVCVLVLPLFSTSLHINRQTNEQEDESKRLSNNQTTQKRDESKRSNGRPQREFDNHICPKSNTWFVRGRDGKCKCGRDWNGIVQCDPETQKLLVLDCYCITSTADGIAVVGNCIFNCVNSTYNIGRDKIYHGAPSDCQTLNREGALCGKCRGGFALPAYSYNLTCIKCDNDHQNWWLYVTYAYVPLTFFIIIILVFRISVIDPKLYMFVLVAQNIVTPMILRILVAKTANSHGVSEFAKFGVSFLATVYGIWNLDFFRVVLPTVCLNINPLPTLALDYVIALYPMLLMGVAYILVELHGCGFGPVLCMWRPFHRFFVRFRRHWGIQTSIMDAFVTFFVLSTTKLLSVSYDFLISTVVFTPEKTLGIYLYYDTSIKLFGLHHLPYALTALAVLTVFIIFPLSLLLCYRCKAFQKCLTKCQLKGRTLDEFVNTFQQYYKDGSNGTFDCRWFAGFHIILRTAAFMTYIFSLSEIAYVLLTCLSIIGAGVVLLVHPYKEEYGVFNTLNTIFLLWQALFFTSAVNESLSTILAVRLYTNYIPTFVLGLVPLMYIIGLNVRHFFKRSICLRMKVAQGTAPLSPLPDRLLHSDQYRDSFGFISASQSSHEMNI